jgi:hypothetical protein
MAAVASSLVPLVACAPSKLAEATRESISPAAARLAKLPLVRVLPSPSGSQRDAACALRQAGRAGWGLSAPDGGSCPRRSSTMYLYCSSSAGCTLGATAPTCGMFTQHLRAAAALINNQCKTARQHQVLSIWSYRTDIYINIATPRLRDGPKSILRGSSAGRRPHVSWACRS